MKNEVEYIRNKYLNEKQRYWFSDDFVADLLLEILQKATPFNRPDFYYFKNNTCFICEHFEFDASKTTRKGSSFKRAECDADRKINNNTKLALKTANYNSASITNCGSFFENIECNQNKFFWKENFISNFKSHYLNLNEYRDNLMQQKIINNKTEIKYVFVIEDTSELGARLSKTSNSICYPISFDFGINTIKKANEIDYVILLNSTTKEIILTHKSEYETMKSNFDFTDTEMFFFNNITKISAIVAIPDKLLNK